MASRSSRINRFFFFPQRGALVATVVSYALLFGLAAGSQFVPTLSDIVEKLAPSGEGTLGKSVLFAASMYALLLLTIYFGISPYYLNWRHALRAVPGSATVVLVIFSMYWGILQIGLHRHRFVVFSPGEWDVQMTLNNLTAAGLVALLSPIGLRSSVILKGSLPHDFSDFQAHARRWKEVLSARVGADLHRVCRGKLERVVDIRFNSTEPDSLPAIMEQMKSALLESPKNPMQPSAQEYAASLLARLEQFKKQYAKKTIISPDSYKRLGEEDLKSVCSILSCI